MTCKDCIHDGVCWKQKELLSDWEMEEEQECCEEAACFVKLPCKVGDVLYYVIDLGNSVHGRVLEIKVLRIEITDEMKFYAETVRNYCYNYAWFSGADFGKTIFLTRELAEEALRKEREK